MSSNKESKGCLSAIGIALVIFTMSSGLLGQSKDQTTNTLVKELTSIKDKAISGFTGSDITKSNNQTAASDGVDYKLSDGTTFSLPKWSFDAYPDYYSVIGSSNIDKSNFPATGKITYSQLDNLGRTRTAKGSLTFENVKGSYGVRQQFKETDRPSGWGSNGIVSIPWKNDRVYRGYFWNKSHLIADSLGGDAKRENAVTGTRTQNVGGSDQKGGMRYPEKKAQTWLESHKEGVLYYSAEPLYNSNEIVPRAVIVSMLSSDKSIDEKVIVYNTANTFTIDYNTGTYSQK